jgi:hypothetical protein
MSISIEDKQKLTDLYAAGILTAKELANKLNPTEKFSGTKLRKGMTNVIDPVLWWKDITQIFNIRKLVIYAIIIGSIFGYGYYKGNFNKPVHVNIGNGKEAMIDLGNGEWMHISTNGEVFIRDGSDPKTSKILRQIKVKDIPSLHKQLTPIGLRLDPILVAGMGMGSGGSGMEVGAGVSWFKWYKYNLDSFLTTKGIYPLGISYSITENTALGVAGGFGWRGDQRILMYGRIKF